MKKTAFRRINNEIFVAQDPIVKIGSAEINFLKKRAVANKRQRARICVHKSDRDKLHEMMIAITAKSYIHPHKHPGKSESFHVIQGAVDVAIFNDRGDLINVVELGDASTGKPFFYRFEKAAYHTLLLKTPFLVVHEITNRPFVRKKTPLASWAPPESRFFEAKRYMKSVAKLVKRFKSTAGRGK